MTNDPTLSPSNSPESPQASKPWLAGLLNVLMPGLGHVYAGQVKKGIFIYLGVYLLAYCFGLFAFSFPIFLILMIVVILYYGYIIVDAILLTKRTPHISRKKWDAWYLYLGLLILHFTFLSTSPRKLLDKIALINFAAYPSQAMGPTIQAGDNLAYCKTQTIKQNDIAVFQYPPDPAIIHSQRCKGMPGDTLELKHSRVFVNGEGMDTEHEQSFLYFVDTGGEVLGSKTLEKYNFPLSAGYSGGNYKALLTEKEAQELSQLERVDSIYVRDETDVVSNLIYPKPNPFKWTADNFGPLWIPKAGETINLTPNHIKLYASLIEAEQEQVNIQDSIVLIQGQQIEDYTFRENYYFMIGDSRHYSEDSRFWDFVSEALITGKLLYLFWSSDRKRIGKKLNP